MQSCNDILHFVKLNAQRHNSRTEQIPTYVTENLIQVPLEHNTGVMQHRYVLCCRYVTYVATTYSPTTQVRSLYISILLLKHKACVMLRVRE